MEEAVGCVYSVVWGTCWRIYIILIVQCFWVEEAVGCVYSVVLGLLECIYIIFIV